MDKPTSRPTSTGCAFPDGSSGKSWTGVGAAVFALLVLLSTGSGHIHSPDGEVNYRTAVSLARFQGYAIEPLPDGFLTRTGTDGREYPQYGPLQPLLSVPLIWLGDLVGVVVPASWLRFQEERLGTTVSMYRAMESRWSDFPGFYPDDHRERVRRIVFSYFNGLVTFATVMLLAVWARSFPGFGPWGWVLPAVYLFGTYAWPHSRPSYTEALATLFLLLGFYMAWRSGQAVLTRGLYACAGAAGLFAACAVLTRIDSAVALPGVLLVGVGAYRVSALPGKVKVQALGLGALCFLAAVSWLPIQNHLRFGSFMASGYEDAAEGIRFNIPILTALWIYLLSPGKGIFWYSPPLIAAVFAWGRFFRRDRWLCLGFAWVVLSFLLIIGKWQNLGGWCWGPRHLFQITPFLLFPLPFLLSSEISPDLRRPARILLIVALVCGVLVQIPGVLVDFMWPLDKSLRTLPPERQTEAILSLDYYGPLLHWRTWRLDRDPDWLIADFWRSGAFGARALAGGVLLALIGAFLASIRELARGGRGLDLEAEGIQNRGSDRRDP